MTWMPQRQRRRPRQRSISGTWRLMKMLTKGRLADSEWWVEDNDYFNAAARRPFISFMLHCICLLLAQSGHSATEFQCLLLGVKRTSRGRAPMSAFDPKRTSAHSDAIEQVRCQRRRFGTPSRPSALLFRHPCHGDDVMDRNNRVGRRVEQNRTKPHSRNRRLITHHLECPWARLQTEGFS